MTSKTPGETFLSREAEPDRRGFFRRASAIGAAVVGGIAVTWADAPTALASPLCCELAHPNGPWCGGSQGLSSFSCPSGYSKRYWTCAYASCEIGCYECAKGSNCWTGPWSCSNWKILVYGGSGC